MRDYNQEKMRLLASLSEGKILDVGFNFCPNPIVKIHTGIDIVITTHPHNYKHVVKAFAESFTKKVKTKFDTILAGDVIEHIENPSAFLRECRKALNDNGKLLITTPNPYYPPIFVCEMLLNKTYYYNKDSHINMFPPRIMLKLLAANGFKCDAMLGCPCYFDFMLPTRLRFQILYVCSKGDAVKYSEYDLQSRDTLS